MGILFSDFCQLLDKIAHSSTALDLSNAKRKHKHVRTPDDILTTWLSALQSPSHLDGLLIYRLLFPEHDTHRRYGMKESLLAREIPAALSFSAPSYLVEWSGVPSWLDGANASTKHGCFGLCLRDALEHRNARSSVVTVAQVNDLLDELACHSDFSSQNVKHRQKQRSGRLRPRGLILNDLFSSITSTEAAYLSQIILRDLSPMLYPVPSLVSEIALLEHNTTSRRTLNLVPALGAWHWALPTIYRFVTSLVIRADYLLNTAVEAEPECSSTPRQAILNDLACPALGSRIEIPSAVKGRNCAVVASSIQEAGVAYAEVKYDGERMQIHVDPNSEPCITIFSKSKRDSTMDRAAVQPFILAALGLPLSLGVITPSPHFLARLQSVKSRTGIPPEGIILEAEMVAYNEDTKDIDEFANLALCVDHPNLETSGPILDSSQSNSDNSANVHAVRHLAVVFFDILLYNGRSLVMEPYEARRSLLESVISPIPGYSLLAARTRLDFRSVNAMTAQQRLIRVFATCIVNRHEGLMIKTEQSAYNDTRKVHRWTKLKKDYIPGLGDSLTCCIVAAAWTKDRARELRVPTDCFTTFYIGALRNDMQIRNGTRDRPCYEVVFGVSYMANRSMLLKANRLANLLGGIHRSAWTGRIANNWAFDLVIPSQLQAEITFVLARPLIFELYGAGFTRRRGSPLYELRFPRVSAIHEFRQPTEAVTLSELQKLAKESTSWIGSEAESEVDDMWSRHSSGSGDSRSGSDIGCWRTRQERHWVKRLTRACQPRGRRKDMKNQLAGQGMILAKSDGVMPIVNNEVTGRSESGRSADTEDGFDEQQPYLWTCLPYQLASRIDLASSYHVTSPQSLLFLSSSFRASSSRLPVQAILFLEEPISEEAASWLREFRTRHSSNQANWKTQVWVHPLPKLGDDPDYRLKALDTAVLRRL